MSDFISREAIIMKIRSSVSIAENDWEIGYNTAMAEIMVWVKNLPSICSESEKENDKND